MCRASLEPELPVPASCPEHDCPVWVVEHRIEFVFVEEVLVVHPSPDSGIEHMRQILNAPVRFQMHAPVVYCTAHVILRFIADCRSEVDEASALSVL